MGVTVRAFKIPIQGGSIGVQMRTNYLTLLANRVNTTIKVKFV